MHGELLKLELNYYLKRILIISLRRAVERGFENRKSAHVPKGHIQ